MRSQVDHTNRAFCQALASGDPRGIAAVYAPDARLLAPGSPLLTGSDEIERFWAAGIAAGIREAKLETLSIEQHGEVNIEVGRYQLTIRADSAHAVTDSGKYVVVHRRLQRTLDIFNSDSVR